MKHGPALETVLRRIAACPAEFIDAKNKTTLTIVYRSLVADLLRSLKFDIAQPALGYSFPPDNQNITDPCKKMINIAIWVFWDHWAQRPDPHGLVGASIQQADRLRSFLHSGAGKNPSLEDLANPTWLSLVELSNIVKPQVIVSDPDRREEFARICLAAANFLPAGETLDTFASRLQTLSSIERKKILEDTAAAAKRARQVREAMARAKALESASRYGE